MSPENADEEDRTSDTPHEGTDAAPEELPEDPTIPSLVEAMELPGEGELLERRQAELTGLYEYLRENGTASEEELRSTVDPDEVGYDSSERFWENCVREPGSLAELPGITAPTEEERRWRYVGE